MLRKKDSKLENDKNYSNFQKTHLDEFTLSLTKDKILSDYSRDIATSILIVGIGLTSYLTYYVQQDLDLGIRYLIFFFGFLCLIYYQIHHHQAKQKRDEGLHMVKLRHIELLQKQNANNPKEEE